MSEGITTMTKLTEGKTLHAPKEESMLWPVNPPPAPIPTGEISDGYHTFNELYEHRHMLFILLMRAYPHLSWRSTLHEDGTMFDNMFIAGMNTPQGQITYHMPMSVWGMLDYGEIPILATAPKWDGHTSRDVVSRMFDWVVNQKAQ